MNQETWHCPDSSGSGGEGSRLAVSPQVKNGIPAKDILLESVEREMALMWTPISSMGRKRVHHVLSSLLSSMQPELHRAHGLAEECG